MLSSYNSIEHSQYDYTGICQDRILFINTILFSALNLIEAKVLFINYNSGHALEVA